MIKSFLSKFTGHRFIQKLLEKNISVSLFLTGVGSVDGVESEKVAFDLLPEGKDTYFIFDVGANKGLYLNMACRQMKGKNFEIHAFEPGKYTFEELKNNSPDGKNIRLINKGLGASEGHFSLHYNEKGSGLASLTKRRLDHYNIAFDISEKVEVTTLDMYCKENSIKNISLLKIDVEGHELDVLKGAAKMFENNAIDIVAFEFGGTCIDTRIFLQDYFYFFKNME
jgi:FkbM family methyltransferase